MPRRVQLVALALVLMTSLPYGLAAVSTPPGKIYSGSILDPVDYNSHLAKMQQGARGAWLYQLLFNAEPHSPALLQTFYVGLGHLAGSGLSLDVIYQLARVLSVVLMVWALWAFMAHYLPERTAWWGLLLCVFGGGAGYLLYLLAPGLTREVSPIEFWLLDAYVFLSAFVSPHFALSIALLALTMRLIDEWTSWTSAAGNPKPYRLLVLFLSLLALGLLQPFDLLLVDTVLGVAALWRIVQRRLPAGYALSGLVPIAISHAALLAYDGIVLYQFPIWQSFTAQNVTLSPAPIYYVFGYLPLLLPALGGLWLAWRRKAHWLIPAVWLIVVGLLVYAPLTTQRRYVLGVQAPMAALATDWLAATAWPWLVRRIRRRARLVMLVYGAAATLTTLLVLVWLVSSVRSQANVDLFLPADAQDAWAWINGHTAVDSVFLTSFKAGNNLVGRTGRRAVLGHWIETADYVRKTADVAKFFQAETPEQWRQMFLQSQRVGYLWYGAEEQSLGSWSPSGAAYLSPVFKSSSVVIYQVQP